MRKPRLHLPFEQWPATDRQLWLAVVSADDPFSDVAGAHLRPATLKRYLFGWRRFLGFLSSTEPDALLLPAARRLTVQRIKALAEHLSQTNTPTSVALQIEAVYHAARTMMPVEDWEWLQTVKGRLHGAAPRTGHRGAVITSDTLLALGIDLMEEMRARLAQVARRKDAVWFRDGLMIALLAFAPLRR